MLKSHELLGFMSPALANDILLKLNEFRVEEASYCRLAHVLSNVIETNLAGRRIDFDSNLDSQTSGKGG